MRHHIPLRTQICNTVFFKSFNRVRYGFNSKLYALFKPERVFEKSQFGPLSCLEI